MKMLHSIKVSQISSAEPRPIKTATIIIYFYTYSVKCPRKLFITNTNSSLTAIHNYITTKIIAKSFDLSLFDNKQWI